MRRIVCSLALAVMASLVPLIASSPAGALDGVSLPDTDFGTVQYDTQVTRLVT